jgi:hypothetical protein
MKIKKIREREGMVSAGGGEAVHSGITMASRPKLTGASE